MRILHTGDWHLGRSLHGQSLLEDQAHVLAQVRAELENDYDALIIAGDIYDRAIPPPEAVEMFSSFLAEAQRLGVQTVVIPGNHDSAVRLAFAHELLEQAGIFFRCDFSRLAEPVTLRDAEGLEVDVFCLPFVETGPVRDALQDDSIRDHLQATELALREVRKGIRLRVPTVLVAHAYVVGGRASDSERELLLGNAGMVPAGCFDDFHYVALGHLHRPQWVERPVVRYSGSIVPYSFSEAEDRKEMMRLEFREGALEPEMQGIPLKLLRGMRIIEDDFDAARSGKSYASAAGDYVSVRLTDKKYLMDTYATLKDRFPHLLELRQPPLEERAAGQAPSLAEADSPEKIFEAFLDQFEWEAGAGREQAMALLMEHLEMSQEPE